MYLIPNSQQIGCYIHELSRFWAVLVWTVSLSVFPGVLPHTHFVVDEISSRFSMIKQMYFKLTWAKLRVHVLQAYGFSPVCVLLIIII